MKSPIRILLTASAILLISAATGFSAPTYWLGSTGSVTQASNWDNGLPDNSGTNAGVVTAGTVIGSGDDFSSKDIAVYDPGGVSITSDLTLTDASISLNNSAGLIANGDIDITLGSGPGGEGYISVNDSAQLLMTGGDLTVGGDSFGTVQQSGGTVQIQNGLLTLGGAGGGAGEYLLSGGTLKANDITFTTFSSWVDFISTGTGILEVSTNNYSVAAAEANISNGVIRLDGAQADKSLFSITDEGGYIKVQAIPEPAVIGLIGIGGLGMLVSRRISKKLKAE